MDQGIETLRQAVEERRRSLELQQQVLLELSECVQEKG
jgi:hypothetical protein